MFTISLMDNNLFVRATGQNEFPLFTLSVILFFLIVAQVRFYFQEDVEGEGKSMIWHQAVNSMSSDEMSED